jgi:hypothetical protein
MSTSPDDLEAVRIIISTLEPFDPQSRERILRWCREKLGLTPEVSAPQAAAPSRSGEGIELAPGPQDIRNFIRAKRPGSDPQFVAAVAYYYQFEAPEAERKNTIDGEDVIDACRKLGRNRPARVAQTMVNACTSGVIDRAGQRGRYKLNAMGENLVAMRLPEQNKQDRAPSRHALRRTSKVRVGRRASPRHGKAHG